MGVDLTRAARDGKYPPLIGRDQEVRIVIETLCRHSKRNPVLVGPAGVGKTAIVEGLATRIAAGNVPPILRGTRIVSLQRSALLGGAQSSGDDAGRLQTILKEAAQDGIVMFIDELHSFMDFADDLKPALARGDVACIGATTDDEYRQIVENDRALERRFQPLRIQAPSAEQTLLILESLRGTLATGRGIDIETEILEHLVALAERYLRNRHFPDKAVDLLEQCIAYALTEGKSSVSREDADTVVQRLIGMPLSSDEQLKTFQAQITDRGILSQFDASALCARLAVTLNGFDLRPERPNATVLFPGDATHNAEALAREAAAALYGGEDRIVVIDFGPMRLEHDVSMLIGSPPGYVGYSHHLPLHQVAQMPWCVLVCANVDRCHPSIRALLARGLATGKITDAAGKQIYLSDALVILTMESKIVEKAKMGFTHPSDRDREADSGSQTPEEVRKMAAKVIGEDLADDCDVICTASAAPETALGGEKLMANLRDLCLREKLHLDWEPSVVSWMKSQASRCHSEHDWERLLDDRLIPLLTPYRAHRSADPMRLMITADDGALQVNPQPLSASWAEPDAEQASSRP